MKRFKDFYAILGVASSATSVEIKRQYRRLAQQNHPDVLGSLPVDERTQRESIFKAISEAYDHLGNPTKRAEYDQKYTASIVVAKYSASTSSAAQGPVIGLGKPPGYTDTPNRVRDLPLGEVVIRVAYYDRRHGNYGITDAIVFFDVHHAQIVHGLHETIPAGEPIVRWCAISGNQVLFWFRQWPLYSRALSEWQASQQKR